MMDEREVFPKQEVLPKLRIPIIDVEFPLIELPRIPPKAPEIDERRAEIVRHAVADDIGPYIPILGDMISDTSYKELRKGMTPEEYERFSEDNKVMPSVLATLRKKNKYEVIEMAEKVPHRVIDDLFDGLVDSGRKQIGWKPDWFTLRRK